MTVTVRIEDAKKEKVDRFLASLLLNDGIKITMQEALGLIVGYAFESEEEMIKKLKELPPLEEDPAWKALEEPKHWRIRDSSRRIEESVYGS